MNRILRLLAAGVLAAAVCGCQTSTNRNSIAFGDPIFHGLGPICNLTRAPLNGNFTKCRDIGKLKKGTSSEVVYFQFFSDPIASVGNETLTSAMRNGDITDLYYADYSVRRFLILGWFTVTAYGK